MLSRHPPIDRFDRERREDDGGHAQVPRVLRRVLEPAAIGQAVAPDDALQLVELEEEGERGGQIAGSVVGRSLHFADVTLG